MRSNRLIWTRLLLMVVLLAAWPGAGVASDNITAKSRDAFVEAVKSGAWNRVEKMLDERERTARVGSGADVASLLQVALRMAPGIRSDLENWLEDSRGSYQYAYFKGLEQSATRGFSGDALVWLHRAADQGNPDARAELGGLYLHGFKLDGVSVQNPAQGVEWLTRAAEDGSFAARRDLAQAQAQGIGMPQDLHQAFEMLRGLHQEGYAPAAADLADFYLQETGVASPDPAKAKSLLEEAAAAGEAYAAYRLYALYLQDASELGDRNALGALQRAANGGVIPALIRMARWYVSGYLVEADPEKAQALARAAERRVQDSDFSHRGRSFYLRQIYRVAVDAASLSGDYQTSQRLLDRYQETVEQDQDSPVQGRMDDYAVITGHLAALGNFPAAQALVQRMLEMGPGDPGFSAVQRVALQVQEAQLLMDVGKTDAASKVFSRVQHLEPATDEADVLLENFLDLARGVTGIRGRYVSRSRARLEKAHKGFTEHLGEQNQYSYLACLSLGRSWLSVGKPGTADRWFRAALASRGDDRATEFPVHLRLSMQLVDEFARKREYVYAEKWSRRALVRLSRRASMLQALGRPALPGEKQLGRDILLQHLHLQEARKGVQGGFGSAEFVDQLLQTVQLVEAMTESLPLARMHLRSTSEGVQYYPVLGTRDQLAIRVERLRQDYLQARAAGIDPGQGGLMVRAINGLVEKHRDVQAKFEKIQSVPAAVDLGQAVSLDDLKGALREGEVLLQYVLGFKHSAAWLITRSDAIIEFLDVGYGQLNQNAADLKRGLDPYGYGGAGRAFPEQAARELYAHLFQPLEPWLSHIKKITVIPSGPLAEVPVSVLRRPVAFSPNSPGRGYEWFVQRFAHAYLPSARSVVTLRKRPVRGRLEQSAGFLGVADPVLGSENAATISLNVGALFNEAGLVKSDQLAKLPPLPDSREVTRTFSELAGKPRVLLFGNNATETRFQAQRMAQNRHLLIGSHGLVGGLLRGMSEPGLVLTPPAVASTVDDGWVSSSEIAGLRLNAPLVILPAVNTVSVSEPGDSEGFRALSDAFFRAGADAQLISHWPVSVDAAKALAVAMLTADEPGVDGAEALRLGILETLNRRQKDLELKPGFWGAFSYVGP